MIVMRLCMVLGLIGSLLMTAAEQEKLKFTDEGTFKILHLSDVHYRVNEDTGEAAPLCRDVNGDPRSTYCTVANTTDFIARLIEDEKPQMIVHTGDIIDGDTHSAADGMNELYGLAIKAGLKWVASLGNHDDNSDLTRPEVMDYILSLDSENNYSENNPLGPGGEDSESYGNFLLEIYDPREEAGSPLFRTYHLDSTTNNVTVNQQQVNWFTETASKLTQEGVPAMLFTHIPMQEYTQAAFRPESGLCGQIRESVSSGSVNSGLFDALVRDGSVKATFVGHDHTNDYCGSVSGVQLCYEGSPGYQGYGHCGMLERSECYVRRARVTTISDFGAVVLSHKRLDNYPGTDIIDSQVLWARDSEVAAVYADEDSCVKSKGLAVEDYGRLPVLSQPTLR